MADDQGKNTRQKVIIIVLVLVVGFVVWQVFGMFGGGSSSKEPAKVAVNTPPPAPMPTPKPAELPAAPAPLTPREMELMQLQQETEAKYVAALNELQMLKVQRDIAQTNKDIASAKLDTVSAEKNIVTLLTPETNNNYAQRLANPAMGTPTGPGQNNEPSPLPIAETAYTVISVTEIQGQWAAVIGAQGKLYNVHIGDVIPVDNSRVVSINRGGVVLQKGETKRTISLVPII